MPTLTYQELLEKAKSHQKPSTGYSTFGLLKPELDVLIKKDPESFISEFIKYLKEFYDKNKEFKSMVDSDREKDSKDTYRKLNTFLKELSTSVNNEKTKELLQNQTANIADRIIKGFEKTFEKTAPVIAPAKSLENLSKEELKLFGFEDGVIDPKLSIDKYHEAIKDFIVSGSASKMTEAEKSNYINRFKKTYNVAVGSKTEDGLLDSTEIENFKLGDKKLESLNEIRADINQDTAFSIAQSLHKKRLNPDVKKDLLIKFFNTIRDKKIRANKTLNKFEEKWLDKKTLEKMIEGVIRQKTRIEYLKDQPPMTQEERREFRRDDTLKKRIKQDDPGRVFEITRGGLMVLSRIVDSLKKTNWKEELDTLTKNLKTVIPPVGEVQDHIENIEDILRTLNINVKDFPVLLNIEDDQYKPRIDNTALKTILESMKATKEALESAKKEKDTDKIKKLTVNLKNIESDKNRILRLRNFSLKGLKSSIDNYLTYLKSKKEEFSTFIKDTSGVRKNIKVIEEHIKELRNHFRDLMREEEFMTRWNRPSSVTEEEIKKTESQGKDFPKEEKKAPVLEKTAMDTDKYQKLYSKFMDSADIVGGVKDSLGNIVKVLALKMLSIIEMGTFEIEKLKKLQEEATTTKGEQKKRILSDIDTIKLLPDKLGIKKDFFNNPYGGKGPSLKDMGDKLNELVRDLEKIDLDKQFEKVNELFINLEDLSHWVKLSKSKDEDIMMRMASNLKSIAAFIMKKAVERRVAPSNVGTMYDIAFGRKKPSPSGVTRRLPNFFIQDTGGLAKKVIEYLEKTGIPDMISNSTKDVSKQIEEAIKKTLKIPGKIEDYLANKEKRDFETKLDLKKAREDLKRVNSLLEGKKDEKGAVIEEGLQDQLDTFRQKNIGQIEKTLKFVLDPLEQLWESVVSERENIPKAEKQEVIKSTALSELLERVSGKPKTKNTADIIGNIKKFIDNNTDVFIASKDKITPKEKFLKDYNHAFKKSGKALVTEIPTDEQIDSDVEKNKMEDDRNIANIKSTIEKFPKEQAKLIKEFNKKHNIDLESINQKKNTNAEWQKYMYDIMVEFNAFIETMGGARKVDILNEYTDIFGKKYSDLPQIEDMNTDIENFKKSKNEKLNKLKKSFIERRKKIIDPKVNENFIKEYNQMLGKDYKTIPAIDVIKKDFKEYLTKEQGDVKGDKELIDRFNKLTGLQLTRLPSKKDIEDQVKKNTGKAIDFADIIESKELALKALQTMPEAVEKRVQKMPADITEKRWYKDLLRDKSHHKTKWIERLLKEVKEPIENIEQYGIGVKRVKDNISSILNAKNLLMSKATKIPIDRIKKQMEEQLKQIEELIKNKNPNAKVMPLITFRTSVIGPLNNLLEAKDNINSMQAALEAHISEYNKLKDFYDTKLRTDPDKNLDTEKEQEKILSGVKAYINFYGANIKKSKDVVDRLTVDIYPYAESFVKSISAAMKEGAKNLNKDYINIIDERLSDLKQLITEIESLENKYRESLKVEKEYMSQKQESLKKEAAYDPFDPKPQLSPSERALADAPSKEDPIVKDKPEFYKKIQKTINYFKKIIPEIEAESLEKHPGKGIEGQKAEEYLDYFHNLSLEIPDYVAALKAEIIPGLRGLLKQKVKIPGLMNVTTNLEDAVQTLDNLMDSYTSARTKLKNRIDTEIKNQGISLTKIKEVSEFLDPKTGEFIDFSDKEKDILKRVFMRQVYKYLDELWSQKQSQMHPTMGERSTDYYNNIWKSFREFSGIKSNKKFISILNTLKAETRADTSDDVNRIYLKSQQLEARKKELEQGVKDLGLDPKKNKDIKELEESIAKIQEKEKIIDRIFNEMLKGSELQYISKIRAGLREKANVTEKDTELEEYAPTAPIIKQKKEEEEKSEINDVVKDVTVLIDKIDEGLKAKGIPNIEAAMDKLITKSNESIKNLEDILKQGKWEIKSAAYRNDNNFNINILHSPLMQSTIRNLLKLELNKL